MSQKQICRNLRDDAIRNAEEIPQIYRTAREYQRFIELERENAKNLSNCKGIPKNDWNQERKDNKLMVIW